MKCWINVCNYLSIESIDIFYLINRLFVIRVFWFNSYQVATRSLKKQHHSKWLNSHIHKTHIKMRFIKPSVQFFWFKKRFQNKWVAFIFYIFFFFLKLKSLICLTQYISLFIRNTFILSTSNTSKSLISLWFDVGG